MNIFQETIRTAMVLNPILGALKAFDAAIELKGCNRLDLANYIKANEGCTLICPLPQRR